MASSRALTTSYSLMRLLSPMNASPILVRTLRTSVHLQTSSDSDSNSESDTPTNGSESKACPLVNQFLKEGPATPYKVIHEEEAMYARLDMPGIGKEGLKLWVEDNSLHVKGEEEVDKKDDGDAEEDDEGPRKYSGDFDLPQGRYKVEEIAAELKNGVLKIRVPKLKLEERKNIFNVKLK